MGDRAGTHGARAQAVPARPRALTAERREIPALDGLRGVAALLIAAYHAWLVSGQARLDGGPLRDALSSGHLAVQLFFVLSGFVLYWPIALAGGRIGPLGAYARRRIARIVPAYYVALLTGVLLFPLLVGPGESLAARVTGESIVAHLLLAHNEARLLPGYDGSLGFGVNPALWTLSVEWAFYLVLPLVAAPFWRRPLRFLALAVLVAAGARVLLAQGGLGLNNRTEALLLSSAPLNAVNFAAGMAVAWFLARRTHLIGRLPRARAAAVGAAAAAIALMVLAGGPDAVGAREAARASALLALAIPAAFAALIASLVLAPATVFASAPARWIGKISYGIFLGHFLVLGFAGETVGLGHDGSLKAFLAMETFVLGGAIVYGWLSWTLIESPARRLARRTRRRRGLAPAAAAPQSAG